jgi:hypothetical protein
MDIRNVASKLYRELPNHGFTYHKAVDAEAVLRDIRDQAQLGGETKAFHISNAALRAFVEKSPSGISEPNIELDSLRLRGYSAALSTLSGSLNAPLSVLLARTAENALERSEGLSEPQKLSLGNQFVSEMEAAGLEVAGMKQQGNSSGLSAAFHAIGGSPGVLSQFLQGAKDRFYGHLTNGQWVS